MERIRVAKVKQDTNSITIELIENSPVEFQAFVGGDFKGTTIAPNLVLICHKNFESADECEDNFIVMNKTIKGNCFFVGWDNGKFKGLSMPQIQYLQSLPITMCQNSYRD